MGGWGSWALQASQPLPVPPQRTLLSGARPGFLGSAPWRTLLAGPRSPAPLCLQATGSRRTLAGPRLCLLMGWSQGPLGRDPGPSTCPSQQCCVLVEECVGESKTGRPADQGS